jgi:hypothetical protein
MTNERRQRLILIALAVVIFHVSLTSGLALAGEWRVWRFVTDLIAHLYGWAGIIWLAWRIRVETGLDHERSLAAARAKDDAYINGMAERT